MSDSIEKSNRDLANQSKIFNISSYARNKVATKRKTKGLGELTPRTNNQYVQFITYSTSIVFAKTMLAPLDRLRIMS